MLFRRLKSIVHLYRLLIILMGRYRGPRLRIIRRLGDITLFTKKKPRITSKRLPLGHPVRKIKRRPSIYGMRLLAKQRCCYSYGLRDYQLKNYIKKARNAQGDPIKNLIFLLESRLDSKIYRSGIVSTMPAARQLITHGHVLVDNIKITIPSYSCNENQIFSYKNTNITSQLTEKIKLSFNPIYVLEYYSIKL